MLVTVEYRVQRGMVIELWFYRPNRTREDKTGDNKTKQGYLIKNRIDIIVDPR